MSSDYPPKYFANRGVERNKRPLKNKVYTVEVIPLEKLKSVPDAEQLVRMEKYKFKDLGYMYLHSWLQEKNPITYSHGCITPDELKKIIGIAQWAKFCQGKREFIIQRRVDGRNVKKKDKSKKLQTA